MPPPLTPSIHLWRSLRRQPWPGASTRASQDARQSGLSLTEVMISGSLLMLVVVNSAQMFMRSQGTLKSSSLRDAAYTRISEDLEVLRRLSWSWACEDGTDQAATVTTQPAACTGREEHAANEVRYKTGRSDTLPTTDPTYYGTVAQVQPFVNACSTKTVAQLMKNQALWPGQSTLAFTDSKVLRFSDPESSAKDNSALVSSGLQIQRTIGPASINSSTSDWNRLVITYSTSGPLAISVKATLVPQALAWCA